MSSIGGYRPRKLPKIAIGEIAFFGNDAARDALAFDCVRARAGARVP
jgi:hypothetical protein